MSTKATVKKTAYKSNVASKKRKCKVEDTGPKKAECFLNTEKRRELAALLTLRTREFVEAADLLDLECDARGLCGGAFLSDAIHSIESGQSTEGLPSIAIRAGETMHALQLAEDALYDAGVPHFAVQEISRREFQVKNPGPEILVPYFEYKHYPPV